MKPSVTPKLSVRVVAVVLIILVSILAVEGMARVAQSHASEIADWVRKVWGPISVDHPYQMRDQSNPALWRLRPSTVWTFDVLRADMERRRATIGIDNLKRIENLRGPTSGRIAFQINSSGFKGPELSDKLSKIRILTLGDSCTFGTLFDEMSYPRSLERELGKLQLGVEVVNGGVEGYSPRHILYRLDDFKELKPDIVVLYVGWNAIYSESPPFGIERHVRTVWLANRILERLWVMRSSEDRTTAQQLFFRSKHLDPGDPLIDQASRSNFTFLDNVERIIDEMVSANAQVVLTTLPSLYTRGEIPTPRALEMGHLPLFTDNPLVLAALVSRYNYLLRVLAERKGVMMIDLDTWARERLRPRHDYFFDAVHLTEEGQQLLGRHMGSQLEGLVRSIGRSTATGR